MAALKPQAAQRNGLANQPHRRPHDAIPMKSDTGNQASARLPRWTSRDEPPPSDIEVLGKSRPLAGIPFNIFWEILATLIGAPSNQAGRHRSPQNGPRRHPVAFAYPEQFRRLRDRFTGHRWTHSAAPCPPGPSGRPASSPGLFAQPQHRLQH